QLRLLVRGRRLHHACGNGVRRLRDPNRLEANIAKGRRGGDCDTSTAPYGAAVPAMLDRVAGIPLSVVRNGLVVTLVQNRRWRSRPFLISGPFVSVDIRRWPAAPDTAVTIAVAPRPRPGSITPVGRITVVTAVASVRIIAVVTAIAPITITPLDILAFDVATFINEARSARITSMAVGWVVAVGRVAATVGTGIGS